METNWQESPESLKAKEKVLSMALANGYSQVSVSLCFAKASSLATFLTRSTKFETPKVFKIKEPSWKDTQKALNERERVMSISLLNGYTKKSVAQCFRQSESLSQFLEKAKIFETPKITVKSWRDSPQALSEKNRVMEIAVSNGYGRRSVATTLSMATSLESFIESSWKYNVPNQVKVKVETWKDSPEAIFEKQKVIEIALKNGYGPGSVRRCFGAADSLGTFLARSIQFNSPKLETKSKTQLDKSWKKSPEVLELLKTIFEVANKNGHNDRAVRSCLGKSSSLDQFLERSSRFNLPRSERIDPSPLLPVQKDLQTFLDQSYHAHFPEGKPEHRWGRRWAISTTKNINTLTAETLKQSAEDFLAARLQEVHWEKLLQSCSEGEQNQQMIARYELMLELRAHESYGSESTVTDELWDHFEKLKSNKRHKTIKRFLAPLTREFWVWFQNAVAEAEKVPA